MKAFGQHTTHDPRPLSTSDINWELYRDSVVSVILCQQKNEVEIHAGLFTPLLNMLFQIQPEGNSSVIHLATNAGEDFLKDDQSAATTSYEGKRVKWPALTLLIEEERRS